MDLLVVDKDGRRNSYDRELEMVELFLLMYSLGVCVFVGDGLTVCGGGEGLVYISFVFLQVIIFKWFWNLAKEVWGLKPP